VVTNVSQNYSEGLGTSITVRSIYSWSNGIIKLWLITSQYQAEPSRKTL
jgi:hypothetical protein